jgi:hypothetical protein
LVANLKTLSQVFELVKVSLINLLSKERTWGKTILSLPTRIRLWIMRSINVFSVFYNMKESIKTYKNKLKTTLNVMNKLEICSTEKRLWEVYWAKWVTNYIKLKNKSLTSVDLNIMITSTS